MNRANKQRGVTLMELMIVVAILGIIASIAYPSYQDSVQRSRRADAQTSLMSFAAAMERHYTLNSTYAGSASGGVPTIFSAKSPIDGSDTFYVLSVSAATASAFTIVATPSNAQASDSCGVLTIDETGKRAAAASDCW